MFTCVEGSLENSPMSDLVGHISLDGLGCASDKHPKHLSGLSLFLPHAVYPVWVCRDLISLSALQVGLMVAPFLMPPWSPWWGDSSLVILLLAVGTSTWKWHLFLLFTLQRPKQVTCPCVTSKAWDMPSYDVPGRRGQLGRLWTASTLGHRDVHVHFSRSFQVAFQSDCANLQSGSSV